MTIAIVAVFTMHTRAIRQTIQFMQYAGETCHLFRARASAPTLFLPVSANRKYVQDGYHEAIIMVCHTAVFKLLTSITGGFTILSLPVVGNNTV